MEWSSNTRNKKINSHRKTRIINDTIIKLTFLFSLPDARSLHPLQGNFLLLVSEKKFFPIAIPLSFFSLNKHFSTLTLIKFSTGHKSRVESTTWNGCTLLLLYTICLKRERERRGAIVVWQLHGDNFLSFSFSLCFSFRTLFFWTWLACCCHCYVH